MQTLLTFSISNFFTVGTLLILSVISNNRKQERKVEALEKERLKTELQYLKAQVNPHFLFNAINSVFVLIKVDPDMASETLIKLSNMLRAQLYEFTEDLIDITQEMDYLENYLALEKIRKGGRLKLDFEKDGPLEGFKIAPLMLIPFLENCFKHLSSYTDRPNIVNVKIKKIDNNLEVEFYNTCEAINLFKKQPLGGIGLVNIRRRLELIYPNRSFLEIQEGSEDFRVKLKIQIEE